MNATDLTQEALLLEAYPRVSYLCRCLLQNEPAAETLTREILSRMLSGEAPDEGSLTEITAQRCLDELTMLPPSEKAPEIQVPEDGPLTTEAAAGIVQEIVDALPEEQRVSLVLFSCGMEIPAIAQLTYASEEEVGGHLNQAQNAVREALIRLHRQGADFPVLPPLPQLLATARDTGADPQAAARMVDEILGRQEPEEKAVLPVLPILGICLGVAVIGFLLWKIPKIFTAPAPQQTASVPETTVQPDTALPETEPAVDLLHGEDGHTHDFYLLDNSSFDCESGGTAIMECRICGMACSETKAPGGMHELERIEGLYDQEATCTAPARITMVCLKCLHFYSEDDHMTHALGHDMVSTVIAPTQTQQGYTEHTCTRCGYSEKDSFVDPIPPETTAGETVAAPLESP